MTQQPPHHQAPVGQAPGAHPPGPAAYGPGPHGPAAYSPVPGRRRTNGLAIAALVCGFLLAPLGVIFGIIALGQIRRHGESGRGLAIAGLAVGAVLTALVVLGLLAGAAGTGTGGTGTGGTGVSSAFTNCSSGVCTVEVRGSGATIDETDFDEAGFLVTVTTINEGSVLLTDRNGETATVAAGQTITVDAVPVTVVSADGSTAVLSYPQ